MDTPARAAKPPFIIENVIATDHRLTLVATSGHQVEVELDGDCCSHSFFDDHSKLDARGLMGERLMSIEDSGRTGPEVDPIAVVNDAESTEYHALIVKTDKQSITVDWRNESNGYYGGTALIRFDGVAVGGWEEPTMDECLGVTR